MLARWAGGLDRADESDLAATIDWLSLGGVAADETPLARARSLLRYYVKRTCDVLRESVDQEDATGLVALSSLQTLLLRQGSERDKVEKVRRDALAVSGHLVSTDAVRHREDAIVRLIAADVATDLEQRRLDVPLTVEAALHDLMTLIIGRRQYFHNWLCALYPPGPPQDANEADKRALFFDTGFAWFCQLLSAADYSFELSRRLPDVTPYEATLAHFARHIRYKTFPGSDREFLLPIVRNGHDTYEDLIADVRSTDAGQALFDRWVTWVQSCTPTCAFERTFDWTYMCHPHIMLTHMYNVEVIYREAGFQLEAPADSMPRHVSIRPSM